MRCERLSGSSYSLHAEGRAIDWHLDARRMGVQGLIFNCKSWWSGQGGLGKYSYCYGRDGEKRDNINPTQAHVDHVHIELNRPGARKLTSFWQSPLGR